jgi:DNA primase
MELIHSAQIDSEITKDLLVQPFENKIKIYKRLKELSVMEPFLSENEAKDEFLSALTAAEKQQERKRTSKDISSAKTNAEEKKIMDDIRRRKTPNL